MTTRASRGTSSLEAAIVIPVLLIFIGVIVGGARVALAQQSVTLAAQAGARAASIERTAGAAIPAGTTAARQSLVGDGVDCDPGVDVTGQWGLPIGTPGTATATVTCQVQLSDLLVPGLPGEIVISRSAESPIDRHRGR